MLTEADIKKALGASRVVPLNVANPHGPLGLEQLADAVATLREQSEAPMKDLDRIIIDPEICHGKPVIRGTRTPVVVILNALAGGDTFETLQREYDLTPEDIRACIAFAASEVSQVAYRPVKV